MGEPPLHGVSKENTEHQHDGVRGRIRGGNGWLGSKQAPERVHEPEHNEHVREINLVAAPACQLQPCGSFEQRCISNAAGESRQHQCHPHFESRDVEPNPHQTKIGRLLAPDHDRYREHDAEGQGTSQHGETEPHPRSNPCSNAPERNAVHARKVSVVIPRVAAGERHAIERADGDKSHHADHDPPLVSQHQAHQGKQHVESFFNRQRPEHVPICRQVAPVAFEPIDVESQRGSQRSAQGSALRFESEIGRAGHVQQAQHGQQQQQAGQDARTAEAVKTG